jgi:hypothetical protein
LVGLAVNVTDVPAQTLVALALIVTDGVTGAVTVMVMELLVAVAVLKQEALEVITHDTTSLLFNDDVVYVALLVPTLVPFTRHW